MPAQRSQAGLALAVGSAAAVLALVLRRASSGPPALPPSACSCPAPLSAPRVQTPLPAVPTPLDHDWLPARLTEFHPDTPQERRPEKFARWRPSRPDEAAPNHRRAASPEPQLYPYVSVAADLVLQGRKVPYGVRVYIEALPTDVLRIVDTRKNFCTDPKRGAEKVIREPGHEPFDIPTAYPGKRLHMDGKLTRYRIDWDDVLPAPASHNSEDKPCSRSTWQGTPPSEEPRPSASAKTRPKEAHEANPAQGASSAELPKGRSTPPSAERRYVLNRVDS